MNPEPQLANHDLSPRTQPQCAPYRTRRTALGVRHFPTAFWSVHAPQPLLFYAAESEPAGAGSDGANAELATSPLNSIPLADLREFINAAFAAKTGREIQFGKFIHIVRMALRARRGWSALFRGPRRAPFSKKTGENWSRIGQVWGSLNAQHVAHLGFTFRVLLQLARLGAELLLKLILQGRIRSGLTETEAKALVEELRPDLKRQPRPWNAQRLLARIRADAGRILELTADTPDLEAANAEIRAIAGEFAAEAALRRPERNPATEKPENQNEYENCN